MTRNSATEKDLATKGSFAEDSVFAERATLTCKAMFKFGNFPKEGDFAML